MSIIFLALASIIVLYFVFTFSRQFLPIKICAICAAVMLTWLWLLVAYFLNWHDNLFVPGIMMGGSVVGIMYKTEKYFQQKQLTNFWLVRLLIIVLGFLSVYLTVTEQWNALLTATLLAILAGFGMLFLVKEKKSPAMAADTKPEQELKEKMEHCCD